MFIDKVSVYPKERWGGLLLLLFLYVLRLWQTEGYAVITYLLGLYYLNQIMLYLSPAVDPEELEFENNEDPYILPMRDTDEFKGFQRKIQELELWKLLITSTLLCFFLTFFDYFNFPIMWPLLVFYFMFMTVFLCRYKIEHMIRYKYIPFDFGKKKYQTSGNKRKFGGGK